MDEPRSRLTNTNSGAIGRSRRLPKHHMRSIEKTSIDAINHMLLNASLLCQRLKELSCIPHWIITPKLTILYSSSRSSFTEVAVLVELEALVQLGSVDLDLRTRIHDVVLEPWLVFFAVSLADGAHAFVERAWASTQELAFPPGLAQLLFGLRCSSSRL